MNRKGFLINFTENRRSDLIKEDVGSGISEFSDALSVLDWELSGLSIAFISFNEDAISFLSLAKKGKRVVTSKNKITFFDFVNIRNVTLHEIESLISQQLRPHFIRSTSGAGGMIPHATLQAAIAAIKKLRPDLESEINRILAIQQFSGYAIVGNDVEILIQEREAIGAALDIFTGSNILRESILTQWAPEENDTESIDEINQTADFKQNNDTPRSFIDNLPAFTIQEESALQHDLFNWPDSVTNSRIGSTTFRLKDRQLELVYANKNKLEAKLGVDLIYYNEKYEQFVLVQYKILREESGEFRYRPNEQLRIELDRMDSFQKEYAPIGPIENDKELRLLDDGFFFKLVPNMGLRPGSGELIKGMYISREYMKFLIGPNGPVGELGGHVISFEDAPRYLTNTDFSSLVNGGWIGTRGTQSDTLRVIISHFLETGNIVILAKETEMPSDE